MRLFRRKRQGTEPTQEKPFIQPKLKVGQAGDKYEVEADKMADTVVNKTSTGGEGSVMKKDATEEEAQKKPSATSGNAFVQTSMFKDRDSTLQKKQEEEPVQKQEEEEAVQSKEEEEPVQKMEEEEAVQSKEEEEPVQRMEEEEAVQSKEEEDPVQKMDEEEAVQSKEDEEPIQKKSNNKASTQSSNIETRLKDRKGKGNKLSGDVKTEMESGFRADFSAVNIHTDTEAIQLSEAMGAQAFTYGNDIYFNKGKYNPNSLSGKHLLAHELTHTIQQKGKVKKNVQKQQNPTTTQQINPISIGVSANLPATPNPDYSRTENQLEAWEKADFNYTPQLTHHCTGQGQPGAYQSYVQQAGITLTNTNFSLFVASHIHNNAFGTNLPASQRIPWIQIRNRVLAHARHHFTIYRSVINQWKAQVTADLSGLPAQGNPINIAPNVLDTFLVSRLQYWVSKLEYDLWQETCNWERTDYPLIFRGIPSVHGRIAPNCGIPPTLLAYPMVPTNVSSRNRSSSTP